MMVLSTYFIKLVNVTFNKEANGGEGVKKKKTGNTQKHGASFYKRAGHNVHVYSEKRLIQWRRRALTL